MTATTIVDNTTQTIQEERETLAGAYGVAIFRATEWGIEMSQKALYKFFLRHRNCDLDLDMICLLLLSIYHRLLNQSIEITKTELDFFTELIIRYSRLVNIDRGDDDIDWFKELNLKMEFKNRG